MWVEVPEQVPMIRALRRLFARKDRVEGGGEERAVVSEGLQLKNVQAGIAIGEGDCFGRCEDDLLRVCRRRGHQQGKQTAQAATQLHDGGGRDAVQ